MLPGKTTTLLYVNVPAQASEKKTKLLISDRADLRRSIKKKAATLLNVGGIKVKSGSMK